MFSVTLFKQVYIYSNVHEICFHINANAELRLLTNSTDAKLWQQKKGLPFKNTYSLPSPWLPGHTQWAPFWRSCLWGWAAGLQLSEPGRYSHGPALAPVSLSGSQPESITRHWLTPHPSSHLCHCATQLQTCPKLASLLSSGWLKNNSKHPQRGNAGTTPLISRLRFMGGWHFIISITIGF